MILSVFFCAFQPPAISYMQLIDIDQFGGITGMAADPLEADQVTGQGISTGEPFSSGHCN